MTALADPFASRPWHRHARALLGWLVCGLVALACLVGTGAARAQGVELPSLSLERQEGGLALSFRARPALSKAVEEALQRGVPVYFVAEAQINRHRWYWRNERITRASRTWRLSYQPLTSSWRVSSGALSQSFTSLSEALTVVTRATDWKIAEADQLEAGERYDVEFSYRLDTNQLPRPMQLDLAAQAEWRLAVERRLRVDF